MNFRKAVIVLTAFLLIVMSVLPLLAGLRG